MEMRSIRRTNSARRQRGRRSVAEATHTRTRLVRHAERLFARKGYGATSLRELARAAGVRMFTIHHHFGSKQRLYEEILRRWDEEVLELVGRILAKSDDPRHAIERVIRELFDFFLAHRERVALNARAALGEGLPRRLAGADRGWVRFMNTTMATHRLAAPGLDPGLLLITLEGILHNHVLAVSHYEHLFGCDVSDARQAMRTKRHLARVVLGLVGPSASAH
jgi:AcrR family transcriptional regulator